jgi:hypothetical protein
MSKICLESEARLADDQAKQEVRSMRSSYFVVGLAAALVLGGCSKKEEAAAASDDKGKSAKAKGATGGADKGSDEKGGIIPTAVEKPQIRGRCENESSDNPFGSLYLYPDKKELFITMNGFASRIPVVISKEDEKKTEFTYKWHAKDDGPVENGTAVVSWIGTKKWKFDFDSIKDSICHPIADDLFYKNLTALGIKAGKYLDAKNNDMIDVVADAQKIISEEKGKTNIVFYRVRSKSEDAGVTVYGSFKPPSESENQLWSEWTITTLGEDLVIAYSKELTRRYSPVK